MEEIKLVIKRALFVSVGILVFGLATNTKEIYLGMFLGSLVSIIGFYLLIKDTKMIVNFRDGRKLTAMISYIKRYALYGIYLGIMGKYFNLPMIICAGIGLLNIKINIQFLALTEKYKKFRDKHLD